MAIQLFATYVIWNQLEAYHFDGLLLGHPLVEVFSGAVAPYILVAVVRRVQRRVRAHRRQVLLQGSIVCVLRSLQWHHDEAFKNAQFSNNKPNELAFWICIFKTSFKSHSKTRHRLILGSWSTTKSYFSDSVKNQTMVEVPCLCIFIYQIDI